MKKLMVSLVVMSIIVFVGAVHAGNIPKTSGSTYSSSKEVKIFFCETIGIEGLTENSVVDYLSAFRTGKQTSETISTMYSKGWTIQQVIPMGKEQFYIIFTK